MTSEKIVDPSFLLEESSLPYSAIPFDRVTVEGLKEALPVAIARARAAVETLRDSKEEPDFENTLLALEDATIPLDRVTSVLFNLVSAEGTEALRKLAEEASPQLAAFGNDIALDEKLFQRIQKVYEKRATLSLDGESARLLEKTYLSFTRNGANLSEDKKAVLRTYDEELSKLSQKFSNQLLESSQAFRLNVDTPEALKGAPEWLIATAKSQAETDKTSGYALTLDMPIFISAMRFLEDRALRKAMWMGYSTRAMEGKDDNRPVAVRIANLRAKRAQLLGYRNHAHFVLEERMAESESSVRTFLERIEKAAMPAAKRDLEQVLKLAQKRDQLQSLEPWDFAYYSRLLKEELFDLEEESLRPYFPLAQAVSGVFEHAERLYGIRFEKRPDLPAYHPEVEVYEVKDEDGEFVGLFYTDFFPRPTKRTGAWMTSYRDQYQDRQGNVHRPHVSIVCNFTKPTEGKPSLLSLDEVRTLFHEFGHALHGLLTRCQHRSLSGTNVYWDFVELPSQLMENWLKEEEGLRLVSKHFETGESLPKETIQKIRDSARFLAGYQSVRQLTFALLDLAWHTMEKDFDGDVIEFEHNVLAPVSLFPNIPGTCVSTGFAHIFSGGYSAGYYSYKWAEALEADVFEAFREEGIFNRETAERFRREVLERGGSAHPMELFKAFRGREPDPDALLRRDGLLDA